MPVVGLSTHLQFAFDSVLQSWYGQLGALCLLHPFGELVASTSFFITPEINVFLTCRVCLHDPNAFPGSEFSSSLALSGTNDLLASLQVRRSQPCVHSVPNRNSLLICSPCRMHRLSPLRCRWPRWLPHRLYRRPRLRWLIWRYRHIHICFSSFIP